MQKLYTITIYNHGDGWVAVVESTSVEAEQIGSIIQSVRTSGAAQAATSWTVTITPD